MGQREMLLAAVRGRVDRVAATGDSSAVLEPAALAEMKSLAGCLAGGAVDLEAAYIMGWLHYRRSEALSPEEAEQARQSAVGFFAECFIAGMQGLPQSLIPALAEGAVPAANDLLRALRTTNDPGLLASAVELWRRITRSIPEDHPQRAVYLSQLGNALHQRFWRTGDLGHLDETVEVERAVNRATPENHPHRALYLFNLGGVLRERFERTGDPKDLDEAVEALRDAVRATPANESHQALSFTLNNLCAALQERFERTGDPEDLDEAVEMGRAAVQAVPDDPNDPSNRAGCLTSLGAALERRFRLAGDLTDLNEAVATLEAALRTIPEDHANRAAYLMNLCDTLRQRFERTGDLTDVNEAVEAGRAAVQAAPHDHANRAAYLSSLGGTLLVRFERTGEPADVNEAVETGRAAIRATPDDHPNRAMYLSNLGAALEDRFRLTGTLADADIDEVDEAVEVLRTAVRATPVDDPQHVMRMSRLGVALQQRFERAGDLRDINEAVQAGRTVLQATPHDHGDRADRLTYLFVALMRRFERTGGLGDLDEAVQAGRAAMQATPPDHPKRAGYLSNLGDALRARFQHTGDLRDLDRAVEAGHTVVQGAPPEHPNRAVYLSGLARALRERFERTGDLGNLGEAVEMLRAAIQITPHDHPDRAEYLDDFGIVLRMRFERTGDAGDLDEAVQAGRAAVQATPPDHPNRAVYLGNLSGTLFRFAGTGDLGDLDEAVETGRAAIRATPHDHPSRAMCLMNLGGALRWRFERTGEAQDLQEAMAAFRQAFEVAAAPPWARISAARYAADLAASSDPGQAAGLLERAVLMLPEVAPRRLGRGDKQHALGSHAAGLATEATALALADPSGNSQDRAVRALSLAEAGRAVLLSQALDTRSDLTDLYDQSPAAAKHFSKLRELLDQDPATEATREETDQAERVSHDRQHLAAELENFLKRLRAFRKFSTFGLPPTIDDLLTEADHGPVVTFNISRYRSDALLLTRDGITSCPLPELAQDTVIKQANTFYRALAEATAPDGDRIGAQQTLRRILEWLWQAAAEPTLSALAALGEAIPPAQDGQPLPRVWWAPGGLLGLLPLHAAGFHTEPGSGPNRRTVLDRVISSYTPTIRTLRHARQHRHQPADDARSLIVAMPTTPGLSPLPNVPEEVRRIRDLLPGPLQLTEPDPASDAAPAPPHAGTPTTATVLANLPRCTIAHFACHGASNRTDPSQSQLFLHDHATTPLTVSALAQFNLDRAQLAYLSACSTADPGRDNRLLDEAIHLTSAFQLAGFPHVVGTLWPINDRLAVEVAESFYTHLSNGPSGTLNTNQAAFALHRTIRAVRDRFPATPSLWAAYLHAGA